LLFSANFRNDGQKVPDKGDKFPLTYVKTSVIRNVSAENTVG
jgi:hypothetical protein